jgi:catechol 2,3-dioxygenase-like lactoylglutathione lyase family enzyme
MSRVQLALRVGNLEAAVDFYSKLFATSPAKRRPGYANFAITEPPLKLILIEGESGQQTVMDHLGVEVESADDVTAATNRLRAEGLATTVEDNTTCCYAVQDKVWVQGPGGEPWEVYTVLGDARADLEGEKDLALADIKGDAACCTDTPAGTPTCC